MHEIEMTINNVTGLVSIESTGQNSKNLSSLEMLRNIHEGYPMGFCHPF